MRREYTPAPTIARFMASEAPVRYVQGPIGSGKTTGSIVELFRRAHMMPPGPDGIRRFRCALVRNTKQQLRDTTMKSFFAMFPPGIAGHFKITEATFFVRGPDHEFEFMFRALDTPDDVRQVLSLELSAAFFEEVREIDPEIFTSLKSRLGRYPAMDQGGCHHPFLIMVSNPPVVGSWLWEMVEVAKPSNLEVFMQPPAFLPGTRELNPDAENVENLPENYYANAAEGASEEFINVYLRNQYGSVQGGQAVYREEYDATIHVSPHALEPIPFAPVYLGADAGLTPAITIGQITSTGQVQIVDEIIGKGVGAFRFIREQVRPMLLEKYQKNTRMVIIDPAARQRAQTDERTVRDIFEAAGFKVLFAKTNNPIARIDAVKRLMTRRIAVDSGTTIPGLLISPACPTLRSACSGGYYYSLSQKGVMGTSPVKNEYSHVSDALQYLCLHAEDSLGLEGARRPSPAVRMASDGFRGWTV